MKDGTSKQIEIDCKWSSSWKQR